MAVFYRQDLEKGTEGLTPEINKLSARLEELKNEVKKNPEKAEEKVKELKETREKLLGLRREFNRAKQFTEATKSKVAEGKNNLDAISAADLMRIDKELSSERRGEFLSKSFLYRRVADGENITEEPTDGKNLKEGDALFVDFGKNKSANMRIGLGHMLGVDVGYVKVDGRIGVRSIINGRVGYYTKGSADGYIPVYSGTVVTIPTASEIGEFEKSKDSKLSRNMDQKESDENNDEYIERISRVPESRGIELNINTKESYDFWISKGFSHEQACGIVANEFRESSANPQSTNGIAAGIFQWEGPRRKSIEEKYNKSILSMSHFEQLNVAWEEMNGAESKVLEPLRKSKTSREAAGVFSETYERPADKEGEITIRGDLAEIFQDRIEGKGESPIDIIGTNKESIEANLVQTSFLGATMNIHKSIVPALKIAENEIRNDPIASKYTVYRADGYNWRTMRGKSNLSYHALGIAFDINPQENMGSFGDGKTDIPESFVSIMKKNGFKWGGDWKSPYDPMHFEYSRYELLAQAVKNMNA